MHWRWRPTGRRRTDAHGRRKTEFRWFLPRLPSPPAGKGGAFPNAMARRADGRRQGVEALREVGIGHQADDRPQPTGSVRASSWTSSAPSPTSATSTMAARPWLSTTTPRSPCSPKRMGWPWTSGMSIDSRADFEVMVSKAPLLNTLQFW